MVGSESEVHAAVKDEPHAFPLRSREMLALKRQGDALKIICVRWQSITGSE
jgi:hypothetical protein